MMDSSSAVQEHVLQHGPPGHHGSDMGNVDPHMGVLAMSPNSVHNHMLAQQVSPVMGSYMHNAHTLSMPSQSPVHIVPNVSPVSLSGSPYVHPGLMQEQTEKYGPLLFHKDDQGLYTCFFTGCGKKLKANFSRHVAKHEMDGDKMDPTLATQIQTSSASKNLGTTKICSHPTHQDWWGTSPEQPVTEFYKRCSKCKKCYIRLQQESKRQRLSLESLNNSPVTPAIMMGQQYSDMYPMGHGLMIDQHHLKRDPGMDDEQGPSKRMRIEDSPAMLATLDALTDKHFKEMAELTARHSANSRKLIADNTAIRMNAELRNTKEKEELEAKLRNQWDQFRLNCLKEREDLHQAQVLTLQRELNGAAIPTRACKHCMKRMYSVFLYQCNLCNEEACIRCQAVMVCGVCGTKSCENCTIKHNWLIWCNRCHKTYCSNHRSVSDDICPGCDQKNTDYNFHQHQLSHHSHLHHDLDHHHLHHPHQELDMHMHHNNHHHHQEDLMGQPLKFEELDHEDHHAHPHSHSHQISGHEQHIQLDQHMHPHMDHHHLPHEHIHHDHHMQHMQHDQLQHDHMHPHQDHHLHQHDQSDHHYQDQQHYPEHLHQHIQHDLADQQYEQNYQDQQEYQQQQQQQQRQNHNEGQEEEEQSQNEEDGVQGGEQGGERHYQEQNHYEQQQGEQQEQPSEDLQGEIVQQEGQETIQEPSEEQANALLTEGEQQVTQEDTQQYEEGEGGAEGQEGEQVQDESEQEQSTEQGDTQSTSSESQETQTKYDEVEQPPQQPTQ